MDEPSRRVAAVPSAAARVVGSPTASRRTRGVDNRGRSRVETLRTALLGGLVVVSLTIADGQTNFAVTCVGLLVALALSVVHLPNFYRLSMVWTFAYVYVIGFEGYFAGPEISRTMTSARFNEAAQYMNASNALLLFGHSLVFRERDGNQARPPRPQASGNGSSAVWFMAVITAYYTYMSLPDAISILTVGRVGSYLDGNVRQSDVMTPIVNGLSSAAGLSAPVMWLYYFVVIRRRSLVYGLLPSFPIFAIQVAIGTRFVLLISLLGSAMLFLSEFPLSGRSLRRMGAIGAVAFGLTSIMRQFRGRGLDTISDMDLLDLIRPGEFEGCVTIMTQIVDYFRVHEHFQGRSIASVFVFWIPRALWRDKPTLLGYWFPREYASSRGYSTGHSVAGGFQADAYVDFGFYGGLVACAAAGLLFGLLELRVDRMIFSRRPAMITACCLYGTAFFAVRSPDTALIVMSGVALMTALFQWTLNRDARVPK